jgi:hypothetical protein
LSKVWRDFKNNTKKEVAKTNSTGGVVDQSFKCLCLTLKIIGFQAATGMPEVVEAVFPQV